MWLSVRHWRIGMDASFGVWLFSLAHIIAELAKHKTVANMPSYARELPCPVGRSRDSLNKLRRHVSIPCSRSLRDRDYALRSSK
jgi:hypothetical protein